MLSGKLSPPQAARYLTLALARFASKPAAKIGSMRTRRKQRGINQRVNNFLAQNYKFQKLKYKFFSCIFTNSCSFIIIKHE